MNRLFTSILCAFLFSVGSFAFAQDKDDKPLVAKPIKEQDDEKESGKKKKESKAEKSEKKPAKKEEKMSEKLDEKESGEKKEEGAGKDDDKKKEGMERLGELFEKAWEPGVKLSSDENSEFLKLIPLMLPGKKFLGDELEWRLLFRDAEDTGSDLVTVNLSKKGSDPYAREMFFQLNYKTNFREGASNEAFEGYHSFALPGVHQLVLIGHIEIRAVAAADLYKTQGKIEEVLKEFPLKKIEKL